MNAKQQLSPKQFNKKFERDLDSLDRAILHERLNQPGITNRDLAKRLKVNPDTVTNRLHNYKLLALLEQKQAEISDDTVERLKKIANRTADKVIAHLNDPNPMVSLKACRLVFEAIGIVGPKTIMQNNNNLSFNKTEIILKPEDQERVESQYNLLSKIVERRRNCPLLQEKTVEGELIQ